MAQPSTEPSDTGCSPCRSAAPEHSKAAKSATACAYQDKEVVADSHDNETPLLTVRLNLVPGMGNARANEVKRAFVCWLQRLLTFDTLANWAS